MKEGFVKVASATPKISLGNTHANASAITTLIEDANKHKVKLLVFPELCITGCTLGNLFSQRCLQDGVITALKYIMDNTKHLKMLIFVGASLVRHNKLFNTAVAINEGKIIGVVPKSNLTKSERQCFAVYKEDNDWITIDGKQYPFGNQLIFIDKTLGSFTVSAKLGDLFFPPSFSKANIIANLTATNDLVGKDDFMQDELKVYSKKCACAYVLANAGSGESTTDKIYTGKNYIYECGTFLAESANCSTGLTLSEIDVDRLSQEKNQLTDRKIMIGYEYIQFCTKYEQTQLTRQVSPYPFIPKTEAKLKDRTHKILQMQAYALKQRVEHTKSSYLIVGTSGGLDSTLALITATKTAKLLNRSNKFVLALTLPSFGTSSKTLKNAKLLAKLLDTTFMQIDITSATEQHLADITHSGEHDLTFENAQARERMQVLMDIANQKNGLVVGTGNLSELALGFTTYNGDHMSMYSINSSLPKTLLKKMVEVIANESDTELQSVLQDILNTPISPELIPTSNKIAPQHTEKIIGPYELHDFFIYYFLRYGFSPRKILRLALYSFGNKYTKSEILHWLKLFIQRFFVSQFKRSCMPDTLQIGSVSFSPRTNWKMPSDASYALWLKELDLLE